MFGMNELDSCHRWPFGVEATMRGAFPLGYARVEVEDDGEKISDGTADSFAALRNDSQRASFSLWV